MLKKKVLIIGSGAGGCALIDSLLSRGYDVNDIIILEKGRKINYNKSEAIRFIESYKNAGVYPIIGKPIIPFGIANCVGGGPEINGALIWKTPKHIIDKWFSKDSEIPFTRTSYEKKLGYWENLLMVSDSEFSPESDYPSYKLSEAANSLGLTAVPARRSLENCQKSNVCAFGCPANAKITPYQIVIKPLLNKGLRFLCGCKSINIFPKEAAGPYIVEGNSDSGEFSFEFESIYLASGTLQSPRIVSKLLKNVYNSFRFAFHLNFKSIALFDTKLPDRPSTMFASQLQEYAKEGIYIMPFNWHKAHIASIVDRHNTDLDKKYISEYGLGLTTQISHPDIIGNLHSLNILGKNFSISNHSILKYQSIRNLISVALKRTFEIITAMNASKELTSFVGSHELNISEIAELESFNISNIELLSVHHMASMPLGKEIIDNNGSVRGFPNIFVADASILPSAVEESPQLSIMAFVSSLYS